jgi:hypothetical protein
MVLVVEPTREGFVDAVFALLEHLCVDAECEPRSPRYFFGFASWPIVEHVRRQLIAVGRAAWDERDDRIRTPSGQIVLARREPVRGWPLDRAVIVCSGDYPDEDTLLAARRGQSVILVIDPTDPPKRAAALRALDDDT